MTFINNENENDKEEAVKVVAQKGVSITRALIMFGFESWSALEPGKKFRFILSSILYNDLNFLFQL